MLDPSFSLRPPAFSFSIVFFFSVALLWGAGSVAPTYAQADLDLEPGYIVTTSGDTTRGLIDNMQWQRAPKRVRFAEDETTSPKTLGVEDIAGFGVGDYVFERHVVNVDQRPVTLEREDPFSDITKRDTLFLQQLVNGSLKLYETNTNRQHFFVEGEEGELEELIFFVRQFENGGAKRVREERFYRQQLLNYRTLACVNASTDDVDYNRADLIEFVASCNVSPDVSLAATSGPRYRFTHVLSVLGSRVASRHTRVQEPATFTGFSPGLQYQLQIEPTERYATGALLVGVGVQRISASRPTEIERIPLNARQVTYTGDLSATVLDLSLETRFRMREAAWRPFVSLELAGLYPLTYDANLVEKNEFIGLDISPFENETEVQEWDGLQVGGGMGVGVEGPRFGSRLGVFYATPGVQVGKVLPALLDVELQVFMKL